MHGHAQVITSGLYSGITPDGTWKSYGVPGMEAGLVMQDKQPICYTIALTPNLPDLH